MKAYIRYAEISGPYGYGHEEISWGFEGTPTACLKEAVKHILGEVSFYKSLRNNLFDAWDDMRETLRHSTLHLSHCGEEQSYPLYEIMGEVRERYFTLAKEGDTL